MAPDSRQPTWMMRAKEWASGRNSSVEAVGLEHLGGHADRVAHVGQQVAVGQLAALGLAGGARGVDDRGQVVGGAGGPALVHLLVADGPGGLAGAQGVQAVEGPDLAQAGQPVAQPVDELSVLAGLGEHRAGGRVAQDPLDLLGRGRLVDRHRDRAGGQDRVVDQRPLIAGPGHQRDPVARLDAGRDQALGQRGDLGPERLGGHVPPVAIVRPPAHHHGLRLAGRPAEHDVRDAGVIRDLR